jgi:hypothetical protein
MPEQPHDMAEQPREAFIYIFGYRGLDLPPEKAKVADVAVVAQLECPGFLGGEHGVIETHRKQHHPAALPLLYRNVS